jgi:hypothetical protein
MWFALVLLLTAPAEPQRLELLLETVNHSVRSGKPARVRVLVRNPPDSGQIWYLQRGFWVVPTIIPLEGDLALTFRVTAPDGTVLQAKAMPVILSRIRTEPEHFIPLRPAELFGQDVDLSRLQLGMTSPGTYSVLATLSTQARGWLKDWLARGGDSKRLAFIPAELFVGPMSSNELPLQVVPADSEK